jgi:hydrophobe/amphiphile efflux-1 (HAE1) family protein
MHFFINRPIFATVISIIIVILGSIAYVGLPVSQYPDIALPTIVVRAQYPGATAVTLAETVATPLEQEINGVEGMLYMESSSTADGTMQLTVTFEQGTDLDNAQVLVQNRVALAEPRLPSEVRQTGVVTQKSSPDMLLVVHLFSPDQSRDSLYISNYILLRIKDVLSRLDGVGNVTIFGAREYSMRVWLDTDRLATLNMTTGDVITALREKNVQVAAGAIGQPPSTEAQGAFQFNITTQGRLADVAEFENVIVKSGSETNVVRLADVARAELGAQDYSTDSLLDGQEAIGIAVFQRPGSNAVATAQRVVQLMDQLSADFPDGLEHEVAYNPTKFVEESIHEVLKTLFEATVLVVVTVFLFLQNWRATIIPVVAIPVSLIGTFAVMLGMGLSLNNLSLFGLVLAIGIVVDDAIVVVENVEHWLERGLSPREAARKAMSGVGGALVAATLVLIAVFVPTAFIPGISGQFYSQFAITIAVSTTISLLVSLTLSPAMSALLLRPKADPNASLTPLGKFLFVLSSPLRWFFAGFNAVFDQGVGIYTGIVSRLVRVSSVGMLIYVGLLGLTWLGFTRVPTSFIPMQDQGYFVISVELPPSASLARSGRVAEQVKNIAMDVPGIEHAVSIVGFSGATRSNNSNAAAVFVILSESSERTEQGHDANQIIAELRRRMVAIEDATVLIIPPPPVPGIGTGGGFKMQLQDRSGAGLEQLQIVSADVAREANQLPGLAMVYSSFRNNTPQIYADVDRTRAEVLNVPLPRVFETLQTALGSVYVNDFNYLGRTYRVIAQADSKFRTQPEDILRLQTRSTTDAVVPLGSLVRLKQRTGPDRVVRYNLYPAADISGSTVPGISSGQAIAAMERLVAERLPAGFGYEWTDLAYQEKAAGNVALFIFPLCVVFVFLALSAQYESWTLPLAVILIVPMGLLFAIGGLWLMGMDNNVLTQVGFIVLVALACKNAILIVEFAKSEEDGGKPTIEAAISAAKLRIRPILMTSIAFILGVVPLVIATGAGSEMRRSLGTAVFSGMIGVTICGLFLTPVFYVFLRYLSGQRPATPAAPAAPAASTIEPCPSHPEEAIAASVEAVAIPAAVTTPSVAESPLDSSAAAAAITAPEAAANAPDDGKSP